MKKTAGFLLRLAISAGIIFYLLQRSDWTALKKALLNYPPGWWLAGLVFYALFQAASIARWRYICKTLGFRKPYLYFLKLYLLNMYVNTFLPGFMGGDVVRGYYLVRDGFGLKESSFSVLVDRGAGLMAICFLLLLFLPFYGGFIPRHVRLTVEVWALAVVIGGGVISLWASLRRNRSLAPLVWPDAGAVFLYGLVVQVLYVFQFAVMAQGLHIRLPWSLYFVIVPITGFLSSLPVSLGGLGLREGSLVYFMGLRGVPQEKALLLGLLVYSTVLTGALPGALVYLRGVKSART